MGYNHENAKEQAFLPPDSILDAVIIDIVDGQVKDFVTNTEGWKGDIGGRAINVVMEIRIDTNVTSTSQLFTYKEEEGKTVFTPSSNLGKFNKKYGSLPKHGLKVKVQTNADGFAKVKLD